MSDHPMDHLEITPIPLEPKNGDRMVRDVRTDDGSVRRVEFIWCDGYWWEQLDTKVTFFRPSDV